MMMMMMTAMQIVVSYFKMHSINLDGMSPCRCARPTVRLAQLHRAPRQRDF